MKKLKEIIKAAFYPNTCPICNAVIGAGEKICRKCVPKIHIIKEPRCEKCGKALLKANKLYCGDCMKNRHVFDKGVSIFEYKGDIKESLYRFKYDNLRCYGDFYGSMGYKMYGRLLKGWNVKKIIPVPMYNKKESVRGYNQAAELAKNLSRYTLIPTESHVIIRIKNTKPQKGLDNLRRQQNLSGAFAVDTSKINKGENVLLVDDIYTTGSTMDAGASVLKVAGVGKVYFLCVATGVDN